jgi:putative chitinase
MIDWRRVQTKLGVTSDGVPGPITWTAVMRHMGAGDNAAALGRAMAAHIGPISSSPVRLAHWLGQMAHESGGFRVLVENLNYTSAASLSRVWPSRFRTPSAATPFVRNPQALANKVYGGRMGNTQPGDGWRFRGRGLVHLTGRSNYETAERATGLPLVSKPDLAADPENAVRLAVWYWNSKNLNILADADDVRRLTRRINGGTIGLADRITRTNRAKALLT